MKRMRRDTAPAPAAPTASTALLGIALLCLVASSNAGPLGPLPNVTSADVGLKQGSCAVGDVVYMVGDEFPGATPCERCSCAPAGGGGGGGGGGSVRCATQRCEPRPGCKALHRPDHCCPTYQCECEQEGRVYGNGEKLVDPSDPCRVCYCQGGEVVCRRIACFVRDDCRPRLVAGRCCPEYDNCPLRGVTALPGMIPSMSSMTSVGDVSSSAAPTPSKENIKQEITIKEITPVSEIPVITDVKIKEILPSPSIEVPEYPSSKSPLIPREAIPDKSVAVTGEPLSKTEEPVVIELISPLPTEEASKSSETNSKSTVELQPSKISLSTQDSINSDIYPSHIPTVIFTMGVPPLTSGSLPAAGTTRPAIIEEEDSSLFDHNPAFPPIPDDLSVIGNHEDENVELDHLSSAHEIVHIPSIPPSTEASVINESSTTPSTQMIDISTSTTSKVSEYSEETGFGYLSTTTVVPKEYSKDSPMLNLRSAIPTELLSVPSSVPEDITGELDDAETVTLIEERAYVPTSTSAEFASKVEDILTTDAPLPIDDETLPRRNVEVAVPIDITSRETVTTTPQVIKTSTQAPREQTTNSIAKSNIATEITSQTELSSLPIETSDQKPHDSSESIQKEKASTSTEISNTVELSTPKLVTESETITVTNGSPTSTDTRNFDNVETTEFVLTSFESSESTTDAVELIKVAPTQTDKNAAIIDSSTSNKNNVLTDLINLVGDVASISDHTDAPEVIRRTTTASSFSDSEELIPVNAGYKSKNSNFNLNSITEIPLKSKNQAPINKQKIVEIEDDDTESITDAAPPNDKVEPTTRRPIIDNVSDTMFKNETEKKDIEIITKSYVPTFNRRPTKVIMKKSNEKPVNATTPLRFDASAASIESGTESEPSSRETSTESFRDVSSEMSNTTPGPRAPEESLSSAAGDDALSPGTRAPQ